MTRAKGVANISSQYLKFYLAAAYGGFQNVDNYYTSPPPLLIAPNLVGSIAELTQLMSIVVAAAKATGRVIVPPSQGLFIDEEGVGYRRDVWSLFTLERIEREQGVRFVEPKYIEHATKFLAREGNGTSESMSIQVI